MCRLNWRKMEAQSSIKEPIKTIDKAWGEEIILVNNEKYCGKLLVLDKGSKSSYHYHRTKMETFYCIEGYAILTVEGKRHILAPYTRPITIQPNMKHEFEGVTVAVILEISTHHAEDDVVRLSKSRRGNVQK